ncbi:MAG: DUF2075 domain-containing protein [Bacteroidetes bacterium]|nr:DUF2075 domain-containing protein [Bacteroidota bacterium]
MPYFFRLPDYTELTTGQQAALNEPNAIAISGGPGTGKSVVSLWRHIRNYGIGSKNSLLLTYSKTLTVYLASSAMEESPRAASATSSILSWISSGDIKTYDEIIIDEAQDMSSKQYEVVKSHTAVVSYGADDQQIVYPETASTQNELIAIFPGNRNYLLDENFRNSYEIMRFVKALFPNKVIPYHTINNLRQTRKTDIKPILYITRNNDDKQKRVIIDLIHQFHSDSHNIAILVPRRRDVENFHRMISGEGIKCTKYCNGDTITTIENIHITTFKSSKGTEFDTVIIPDFEDMPRNIAELYTCKENDYYVALTRTKRNLFLISERDLSFLELSEAQKETYTKEIIP